MILKTHYGVFNSSINRDILKSKYVRRLDKIFQDDLSPVFCIQASKATRLEHTLGVVHLATLVNVSKEEKKLLEYSALLHDIGLPCFGHIGESVMQRILGKDHEENAISIIEKGEVEAILKSDGILDEIIKIFRREHYLSDLIFGSIDLDNIDNLYVYQIKRNKIPKHNSLKLASSFSVENQKIFFNINNINEIKKWKRTRYDVYSFLMKKEHLIRRSMLEEAIFYYCLKDKSLLDLDNSIAIKRLLDYKPSRNLIERLINNKLLAPKYFKILNSNAKAPKKKKDWAILNRGEVRLDKEVVVNTIKGKVKLNKIHEDKVVYIAF